jgi:hypothetical protein
VAVPQPDGQRTSLFLHGYCTRAFLRKVKLAPEGALCCACGHGGGLKHACQGDSSSLGGNGSGGCELSFHPMCGLAAGLAPGCCHRHSPAAALAQRLQRLLLAATPAAPASASAGAATVVGGDDVSEPEASAQVAPASGLGAVLSYGGGTAWVSAAQYHLACALLGELTWAHLPRGQPDASPALRALAHALRRLPSHGSHGSSSSVLSAAMVEVAAADRGAAEALGTAVALSAADASAAAKVLAAVLDDAWPAALLPVGTLAPPLLTCGLCHQADDPANLNSCPGRSSSSSSSNHGLLKGTCPEHPGQKLRGNGRGYSSQCTSEDRRAKKPRAGKDDGSAAAEDEEDEAVGEEAGPNEAQHPAPGQRSSSGGAGCSAVFHPGCAGWVRQPGGTHALVRQG